MTTIERPRIYFSAPIRAPGANKELLRELVEYTQQWGILQNPDVVNSARNTQDRKCKPRLLHDRDMEELDRADVMVGEVSNPSLGVGYEYGRLTERCVSGGRCVPMLALYTGNKQQLSAMIGGSPYITTQHYTTARGAKLHIARFFKDNKFERL